MQKKIIALAIAGLVSSGAFAQSNVTVYGIIDTAMESRTVSGDVTAANNITRYNGVSGGYMTSRLGFKGSESLGGGMSANFMVETGLGTDAPTTLAPAAGAANTATMLGDRSLTVGLSGNFGSVNLGRQYSPIFNVAAAGDTFMYAGAGSAANIIGGNTSVRRNNSIRYDSPSMSGFTAAIMWDANTENTTNVTKKNDQATGLSLRYANGPVAVGYGYEKVTVTEATGTDQRRNALTAGYNFGVVSVQGGHLTNKVSNGGADNAVTYLGVKAPVGAAGTVRLQWGKMNDRNVTNADQNFWGLGYGHAMSKRTNLYVNYGTFDNKINAAGVSDWRSLQGGINHSF
ncbi:MAG: porin [Pseudomonadota bacterium]|nr:porin [Pseudomonadota bacterium]